MNATTFHEIALCYQGKGKQVSRSQPLLSDDPLERYKVIEGAETRLLNEKEFVEDAKRIGCYFESLTWDYLELTEDISAQEAEICGNLRWTKERLNETLQALSVRDAVCVITRGPGRRRISLGPRNVFSTEDEETLYYELQNYKPHA